MGTLEKERIRKTDYIPFIGPIEYATRNKGTDAPSVVERQMARIQSVTSPIEVLVGIGTTVLGLELLKYL